MVDKAYKQFARETRGRWVGPVPILDFLGLLPPLESYPAPPENIFDGIPSDQLEKDMYPELVDALKSLNFKSLQFANTSNYQDDKAPAHKQWRPDISTYAWEVELEDQNDPTYPCALKEETPSPTRISDLLLSFELKRGKHDPFCDKPDGPDALFESAYPETQEQIAAILNEMLSYSFGTHAFSVFMDGHIARLFRADRAGVLVSEAFDYRSKPTHLTEFLHRFDNMTPSERGTDSTVGRGLQAIQVPVTSLSLNRIKVKLEGSLPHTESLVSRGRRVVHVREESSKELRIMKDGWRANLPGMTAEWNIVAELHRNQVPHVPRILSGGDIWGEHHQTLTQGFADSWWRVGPKTKLTPRVHYRFIEEDAGKPLEEFKNAKELTCVLADVIEALQVAWVRCRYLHRDVSSKNIMISPCGKGSLIDWEFAKKVPEGEEPRKYIRAYDRTGTWAYISAALLRHPGKPHSPLDDLQSVYWVAFENALNYLHHEYKRLPAAAHCLIEYDPLSEDGGNHKTAHLFEPRLIEFLENRAFSNLMYDFCHMMRSADIWEGKLVLSRGPAQAGPQPPEVPDHSRILERFHQALDCPDDHWSPRRNDTPRLWDIVGLIERGAPDTPTSSRSTASQKRLHPSGRTSEVGELRRSKRAKPGTSASLTG